MKKNITLLAVILCFLSSILYAQDGTPLWQIDLSGKAKWVKVTSAGTVVISTNTALIGVDPVKKEKIWEVKAIDEIKEEAFVEVDGTPFAFYESFNPLKSLRSQTSIIDYTTGRIIYNNLEADVVVREKTPLVDIGAILLEIKQSKKVYLVLIDIASGKERWKLELSGRKTGFGLGALKQSMKSAADAAAITDSEGNILFPDDKILKRINAQTGVIMWESKNEKSIGRLNLSDDGKAVYLGSGRRIAALDIAQGKELWKEPLKISGEFELFYPKEAGKMFVITSAQVNLISSVDGTALWKKPVNLSSSYSTFRMTDKGMIVAGGDDKMSTFEYFDFNGQPLWRRTYTTNAPVVSFQVTAKGILFATAEDANMISLETGKDDIWKKRIKLRGLPVTFFNDKIGLIYSDERLYEINLEDVTYKLLAEKINFKGKDEDVRRIEVQPNGYLLSSQQNVWMIGKDGKVIYNKYYPPVSLGGTAGKILGFAGKVYATVDNIETKQTGPNEVTIQRSERGDKIVGDISKAIANRKNTFLTQDALFITTKVEDGAGKKTGMVKVDKATGEEKGKIVLKTMDPIYEVDNAAGVIFVLNNDKGVLGTVLSCFKL